MKIFGLTRLGRRVARKGNWDNNEELEMLKYLRRHKTASDDELEINCGGAWALRHLKNKGLVVELTT